MAKIVGIAGVDGLGQAPLRDLKVIHVSGHALKNPKYAPDLADLQKLIESGQLASIGEINKTCSDKLPDDILNRTPTEAELDQYIDCNRVAVGLERKYTRDPMITYAMIAGGVVLAGLGAWFLLRKK